MVLTGIDGLKEEQTRRSRGFLFLSFGTAAALAIRCDRLQIFENGVGAINLPYERIPAGVPNSHAVHPQALLLFARLIEALTGSDFTVVNPCAYQTKEEMCLHPAVQGLRQSAAKTFSCDGFPVRRAKTPQCGLCTSCILRRLAMFGSNMASLDESSYILDILSPHSTVKPSRLRGLYAMDWQVERIERALDEDGCGWNDLATEFPDIANACAALMKLRFESEAVAQSQLVRLFTKHCAEWKSFPVHRWIGKESRAA